MLPEAAQYKKEWQSAQKKLRVRGDDCAFVYVHLQEDTGEPFYVGIGEVGTRPWDMRHHSRTDFHRNVVKKHGVKVQIVLQEISLKAAKDWEVRLIKIYRDAGHRLVNLTDGGDGTAGMAAHNRKSVLCLETGVIYCSAKEAADSNSISISTVSQVCSGDYRLINGPHFIYSSETLPEHERKNKIREIEIKLAGRRKKVLFNKAHYHGVVDGKDVKGRSAAGPTKLSRQVYSVTDDLYFPSASAAARHYNVAKSAVIELCLGKNNRRTVGGIIFKYVGDE